MYVTVLVATGVKRLPSVEVSVVDAGVTVPVVPRVVEMVGVALTANGSQLLGPAAWFRPPAPVSPLYDACQP